MLLLYLYQHNQPAYTDYRTRTMSSDVYGIILLGNSGAGKSFLANTLLGAKKFRSEYSPTSVTKRVGHEDVALPSGGNCRFFDIPGLIESDQAAIESNKREIRKAFKSCSYSIVCYVFNVSGNGRLSNEDIVAFKALDKACTFDEQSLLLIINGVSLHCPENYHGLMLAELEKLVDKHPPKVSFVEQVNLVDQNQVERLSFLLWDDIVHNCVFTKHKEPEEIVLQLDELAKQTKQLQEERLLLAKKLVQQQESIGKLEESYQALKKNMETRLVRAQNDAADAKAAAKDEVAQKEKEMQALKRKLATLTSANTRF